MTDTVSFFNTVADVQQVENLVNSLNKLEKVVTATGRGKTDGIKELEGKLKSLGVVGTSAVQVAAANLGSALAQLEALQSRYAAVDAKFQNSTGKQQTELARQLNAMLTSIVKTKGLIIGEMSSLQSAIAANKSSGLLLMNPQAASQWTNGMLPSKSAFEAAVAKRVDELKAVANTAIMQVQTAMLKENIAGSYSNVDSKVLHRARVLADVVVPSAEEVAKALTKKVDDIKVVADAAKLILYSKINEGWSSRRSSETIQAAHIADLMLPGGNTMAEVLARRTRELKGVGDAAKLMLQTKLLEGPTSSRTTGKLNTTASQLADMVYPPKALFEAELAKRQKVLMQAANAGRAQLEAAMAKPIGAYQQISFGSNGVTAGALVETTSKVTGLSKAFQSLGIDMNTVHSSARGLASGFGALWLTWGQMVPLMAGAGISFGMKTIIALGAQVQDVFTQIRVLANNSAEEVKLLNTQMQELATSGPYGPLAIAEAMKTLALAGLDANEVLEAMPEVKTFAVAGALELQAAADALTTIGVAFNIEAKNYGYISDVMSKAAAESKSSVEGMASAFKTASVVNQQYGVSLEDVAVGLSLLANAGISGTAAGTALRNMYADLSERTPKVAKALKELNVVTRDSSGLMREQGAIFKDLMTSLDQRSGKDAADYLRRIFSERGAKEAIAILNSLKKEAKESKDTVANAYDELAAKVGASAAFAVRAAAEMSLTPLNQMKQVASALQTALVGIFDDLAPTVLELSRSLQNMFKSEGFKSGVQELAIAISKLTTFIFEHIKAIANTVLAYFEFKAVLTVVSSVLMMVATGAEAAAAGIVGMGAAAQVLTKGNPILLILSGIVAALGAGWALYSLNSDSAKRSAKEMTDQTPDLLAALEKELARVQLINQARREGISLTQLEMRNKVSIAQNVETKAVQDARARLAEAQNPTGFSAGYAATVGAIDPTGAEVARTKAIIKAQNELTQALDLQARERNGLLTVQGYLIANSAKEAEEVKKQDKARRDAATNGIADAQALTKAYKAVHAPSDNSMAIIVKDAENRLKILEDSVKKEQELLKASYEAREIDQGRFLALEVKAAEKAEAEKLAILERELAEYTAAYAEQTQKLIEAADKRRAATTKPQGGELEQQAADLTAALENLANSAATTVGKIVGDMSKIKSDSMQRLTLDALKSKQALVALGDASEKFWKDEQYNRDKAAKQANLEESLRFTNPGVAANILAQANEMQKYADRVQEMDKAYQDAVKAVDSFNAEVDPDNMTYRQNAALEALQANLNKVVEIRDKLSAGQSLAQALAIDAGNLAQLKVDRDTVGRISTEVAGAIELGLTKGGKEGAKALRALIVAELTRPVRLIVQAVVNPIVGAITSALGLTGTASAAGTSLGGVSTGVSALSLATSTFMSNAGSVAAGIYGGIGELSSLGIGEAVSAGMSGVMSGAFAEGFATLAGALGPVALGLAGVYMIAKSLDHSGTPHTGGGAMYTAGGGLQTQGLANGWSGGGAYLTDFGGYKVSAEATKMASGIVEGIVGILDTTATTFGQQAGYAAATAFADDSSSDGAWGALAIKLGDKMVAEWGQWANGPGGTTFSDGNAGTTEYLAKISNDVLTVLNSIDMPEWAKKILNELPDGATLQQISETVAVINKTQVAWNDLGKVLIGFSGMTDEARLSLTKASGGIETLVANTSGYYANFYTEAERNDNEMKKLVDGFDAISVAMPKTREEFRATIEQLQRDTATNPYAAPAIAKMMEMQESFANLIPFADAAAESVRSVAEILANIGNLKAAGEDLQIELLRTMGDEVSLKQAAKLAYDKEIEGLTSAEIALIDLNKVTQARIDQIISERQAIADGIASWEHYFSIIGTAEQKQSRAQTRVEAVLPLDIDTIQEYRDYVSLLTAEFGVGSVEVKKVTDIVDDFVIAFPEVGASVTEVVKGLDKALARLRSTGRSVSDIANSMISLEDKIFQLQNAGNTGALRGKILAGMSDVKDSVTGLSERDLQQLVWTLEDAADASSKFDSVLGNLYQTLGMTAQIHERELAALPPSVRAMQELLYTVTDIQASISQLTSTIATLDAVISQAKTTSNNLRMALGGQDQTETNLWAKLNEGAGTAAENLSTIDQLLGIINNSITEDTANAQASLTNAANTANEAILNTIETQIKGQETQLENAQKLLDFGNELADFVKSLQLGELSTATPGQKLALAQQAYQNNLAGAAAGDATAAQALQGSASDYLSQARAYDPAAYNQIFSTVTSQLTQLSRASISDNQQIINAANTQISILTEVQNKLTTQTAETITGNIISDTNRQKLESLLTLSTSIEAQAVLDRAAAKLQLANNEASLTAIKDSLIATGPVAMAIGQAATALSSSGLLTTTNQDAANSLAGISAEVSASNDEIVEELKSVNVRLQVLIDTIISAASADIANQNAVASSIIGALSVTKVEAPVIA